MMTNLWALMLSFGKIGMISLGGGNSMLKLIEFESVSYRHWLLEEEFVRMVGSTFLFPGLTAVKLAALIGHKIAGIPGLILAVISINLPGLVLAVGGYRLLNNYNGPMTHKIMIAVQYGALALLAAASFSIAQGVVGMYYSLPMVVITIVFFLALTGLQISPFWGFLGFIGICFFIIR